VKTTLAAKKFFTALREQIFIALTKRTTLNHFHHTFSSNCFYYLVLAIAAFMLRINGMSVGDCYNYIILSFFEIHFINP